MKESLVKVTFFTISITFFAFNQMLHLTKFSFLKSTKPFMSFILISSENACWSIETVNVCDEFLNSYFSYPFYSFMNCSLLIVSVYSCIQISILYINLHHTEYSSMYSLLLLIQVYLLFCLIDIYMQYSPRICMLLYSHLHIHKERYLSFFCFVRYRTHSNNCLSDNVSQNQQSNSWYQVLFKKQCS